MKITNTNCNAAAAKMSSFLLQTAEIRVENPSNKKQITIKVLFDQDLLFLRPFTIEDLCISTFGNKVSWQTKLDKVSFNLKGLFNLNFEIKLLRISFKQINSPKTQFNFLENLNLADSGC